MRQNPRKAASLARNINLTTEWQMNYMQIIIKFIKINRSQSLSAILYNFLPAILRFGKNSRLPDELTANDLFGMLIKSEPRVNSA